ncbi:MAG: hypothetical protein KJ607_09690 [Bacteroidetes bacterium]|nr:hypothetical protein [Bacteroidota bacterium]
MSSRLSLVFTILQILLLVVSALMFVLYFAESINEDTFLGWAYVLLIIGGAAVAVFALVNIFTNFRGMVKSLIGIVILAALVGIGYALASDEVMTGLKEETVGFVLTPGLFKTVGTGIYTMYLLIIVGIASVVITEIVKIFK